MSAIPLINDKPFKQHFQSAYMHATDDSFRQGFLIKCSRRIDEWVYRFVESPKFDKINKETKRAGFKNLFSKYKNGSNEQFEKGFIAACKNGCGEMVELFTTCFSHFKTLSKSKISEALKIAISQFKENPHLNSRYAKVIEEIISSNRSNELTDKELNEIRSISPTAEERFVAIISTRNAMKQLEQMFAK